MTPPDSKRLDSGLVGVCQWDDSVELISPASFCRDGVSLGSLQLLRQPALEPLLQLLHQRLLFRSSIRQRLHFSLTLFLSLYLNLCLK